MEKTMQKIIDNFEEYLNSSTPQYYAATHNGVFHCDDVFSAVLLDELMHGNLILIRHKSGWLTAYAHNQKLLVKKGQKVKKGQNIALVGATGNVKSPQLHFEIRYKTKVVNPQNYLK